MENTGKVWPGIESSLEAPYWRRERSVGSLRGPPASPFLRCPVLPSSSTPAIDSVLCLGIMADGPRFWAQGSIHRVGDPGWLVSSFPSRAWHWKRDK